MPKTVIYTVITNDYDNPQRVTIPSIPHILFTDDPDIDAPGWTIVPIDKTEDQRLQRKIKILGHPELDKYDVTVYIDANISLKPTANRLIQSYRGGLTIGTHTKRNCVYAEGLEVKKQGKAPDEVVNTQIKEYYENNFPYGFGMWSSGFMIRDRSCKEMCEIWHAKLQEHSHRDQLSLPWAIHATGIKPQAINMHSYMSIAPHKIKEPPRIVSMQPWRSDKNLGKANNDEIEKHDDDDWIVLTDGDSCWVLPDWGTKIEQVIMDYGNEYDLIGCVTNRLGGLHQCYNGEFDNEVNGFDQWEKANKAWEDNGTKVEPTSGVAGVCLIFKKSTWKRVGGFKENIITADTEFNKAIVKTGGKVGLAKGLYRMHLYRIWEKEHRAAWTSTQHLK